MIFYQSKELHEIIIKIMNVFLICICIHHILSLNARVICYLSFELLQRQVLPNAAQNIIFTAEDKQTMENGKQNEMNVLLSDL